MRAGAVLSDDGVYRYRLWRHWGPDELMAWIMLNPSTADASIDDPTIRRCMGFARREGYDGIEVINLFALRATDPKELVGHPDAEGPDNVEAWREVLFSHRVGMIVAGYGNAAARLPGSRAANRWRSGGWYCLGSTKAGHPRHPLYVAGGRELVPFRAEP